MIIRYGEKTLKKKQKLKTWKHTKENMTEYNKKIVRNLESNKLKAS